MKKHTDLIGLITLTIVCTCQSACLSQSNSTPARGVAEYYPKKLVSRVELLAGLSFVQGRSFDQGGSNAVLLDGKLGFSSGLGLTHELNSKWEIRINLLYEIKGHRQVSFGNDMTTGYARPAKLINELTLNYLSLSPMPVYRIANGRLAFGFGPYLAYLSRTTFHQEFYVDNSLVSVYRRRYFQDDPLYKNYDVGLTSMISYAFSLYDHHFSLNLVYNHGLTNVAQPRLYPYKNNTAVLFLTFRLPKSNSKKLNPLNL